jgi:hypothetical protein
VSQRHGSRIEKGELRRSEVETLAVYVRALGGKPKIIADFGNAENRLADLGAPSARCAERLSSFRALFP